MSHSTEPTHSTLPLDEDSFINHESTIVEQVPDASYASTPPAPSPLDDHRSDTIHTTEDEIKSSIDELQSMQLPIQDYQQTFEYFPMLAPAPADHVTTLQRLADLANESYLNDSDGARTRSFVEEVPTFLDAAVQTISRLSGSIITARSVSFNYAQPSKLNVYSTITSRADKFVGKASGEEEIAYFAHEAHLWGDKAIVLSPLSTQLRSGMGGLYFVPHILSLTSNILPFIVFLSFSEVYTLPWQGRPAIDLDDIGSDGLLDGRPAIAWSRLPFPIKWDIPFSKWPADQVTGVYSHIFYLQPRLLQQDPQAESAALQWLEESENEPFRRQPDLDTQLDNLYTDEEAAYYHSMLKYNHGPDAYALLTAEPYALFDLKFRQAHKTILIAPVVEMMDYVEINERLDPPQ
ncbi:hypothetical protein FRC11_002227, partial [Ceratobasidium sp. 423]